MRSSRPSLPALLGPLALLLALAPRRARADFLSCASAGGASVLAAGAAGFDARVKRALYPSPVPAFYADVETPQQIAAVVKCAGAAALGVCPRSGGHSFIGQSSCEGVVVDLFQMKDVKMEAGGKVARVQAGATLGEMLYNVLEQTNQANMVGIGLCPSVGVGGYMLGGGHNPYSGKLGLTCESVQEYEFVTLDGRFVKASKTQNQELFWASCGGGGGHFGVLWRIAINTHDSAFFDKNVYFRYEWDIAVAGEVLSEWLDYDQDGGDTWLRLEVNANSGLYGYGVCWNAGSVADCEARLGKHSFFNVKPESRTTHVTQVASSVSEFQRFIGPAGKWAWIKSTKDNQGAFLNQNFDESNKGLGRLYSSAFWSLPDNVKPSVAQLQKMSEICSKVDGNVVSFTLCQWNPWAGKQRSTDPATHAFAHRSFDVFTELIGEAKGSSTDAGLDELKRMETEIKELTGQYVAGVYVSYPEGNHLGLSQADYSYLYWGQGLPRLAALKAQMDPNSTFQQVQPMPSGQLACPAKMSVTGAGPAYKLGVSGGYSSGQAPGMHLAFALADGCSIKSSSGANVGKTKASGPGTVYDAELLSNAPFSVTVDGGNGCKPKLVAVNSVVCDKGYSLEGNKPMSGELTTSSDPEKASKASSEGGLSTGAIVAISTSAALLVLLALCALCCIFCIMPRWKEKGGSSGTRV